MGGTEREAETKYSRNNVKSDTMARPRRLTVDFFPHYVKGGRTIFILEDRFGNDGYAFWFKILEVLGESEGHYYDCSNGSNWAFLLAKTHMSEKDANEIIDVLIDLGKIDSKLWREKRIIWVDNFVKNIAEVYRVRHADVPEKPVFDGDKPLNKDVSTVETPNGEGLSTRKPDRVEESREKESREEDIIYPVQEVCDLWNKICASLPSVSRITEKRRKKVKTRLKELGKNPEEQLAKVETLFRRVQASDFLSGRKSNWCATFDWIFENPDNWQKVLDGNYDNNRASRAATTGNNGIRLGVGEFVDASGRRTYGTGRATIQQDAPPRPSDRHQWSAESNSWIIL